MNDTIIQVDPSVISNLAAVFTQAKEAIETHSQLKAEIEDLNNRCCGYRFELEHQLNANNNLRLEIDDLQSSHDRVVGEINIANEKLTQAELALDAERNARNSAYERADENERLANQRQQALVEMQTNIATIQSERDDYGMKHLAAVEELERTKREFSDYRASVNNLLGSTSTMIRNFTEAANNQPTTNWPVSLAN